VQNEYTFELSGKVPKKRGRHKKKIIYRERILYYLRLQKELIFVIEYILKNKV
jgi:hypothetical protein